MSAILKGLLQPQIQAVLTGFSSATYTGPPEGISAQTLFVDQLSTAIALAVQTYLNANVIVNPGQAVTVATVGGPTAQAGGGSTVSPGKLTAP